VKESDNLEDQSWIPIFWVNPELPDLKPGTSGFAQKTLTSSTIKKDHGNMILLLGIISMV